MINFTIFHTGVYYLPTQWGGMSNQPTASIGNRPNGSTAPCFALISPTVQPLRVRVVPYVVAVLGDIQSRDSLGTRLLIAGAPCLVRRCMYQITPARARLRGVARDALSRRVCTVRARGSGSIRSDRVQGSRAACASIRGCHRMGCVPCFAVLPCVFIIIGMKRTKRTTFSFFDCLQFVYFCAKA